MAASGLLRLDRLLVERGLAPSRDAAKEMIAGGRVKVSGFLQHKPASMVSPDAQVEIADDGAEEKWVSRGAHKLLKGLDFWGIDPTGMQCIDIGASTGGFTQVLLARGASRVAAVDVGYGQLAWSLRNDARVRVMERTNARYVTPEEIGWSADLLTVDASFISLRLLLPNLQTLFSLDGTMIALVKPQFEAGRGRTSKGVVRDPALHEEVLRTIAAFVRDETELALIGATHSPIKGPEGNIEFIFYMKRTDEAHTGDEIDKEPDFSAVVREAHTELAG
ncbi:TlyA family RNA methyltransferase [Synergistaceae bacterium OttesenSCG-928-I11]|nr:TlyA family RNA methyltransferase [Synergistaceae bacterium OttesenSCG-928-I11]